MKRRDFLQTAGGVAALACAGVPGMSRATESGISPVVPLGESYTDGVLVMHRGKIVFEQYFGHCVPHTRHIINSATKVVIARFGSAKTASSRTLEHLISPIHDAIVAAL